MQLNATISGHDVAASMLLTLPECKLQSRIEKTHTHTHTPKVMEVNTVEVNKKKCCEKSENCIRMCVCVFAYKCVLMCVCVCVPMRK